jgi:hypothetical protein
MSGFEPLPALPSETRELLERLFIWNKGTIIPGWDAAIWRWDCDGRVIRFSDYGIRSEHGWEKDHAVPLGLSGPDNITNLRPRHWHGNASSGGILGSLINGTGGFEW